MKKEKQSREQSSYDNAIKAIWRIFDDVEAARPTAGSPSGIAELLYQEKKNHAFRVCQDAEDTLEAVLDFLPAKEKTGVKR